MENRADWAAACSYCDYWKRNMLAAKSAYVLKRYLVLFALVCSLHQLIKIVYKGLDIKS